jgi:hypothetical protein
MRAFPISDGLIGPEGRGGDEQPDARGAMVEGVCDAHGPQAKPFRGDDARESANLEEICNADAPTSYPRKQVKSGTTGFGPGTMIMTRDGEIAAEWLDKSHHVLTRDNGFQPIRWIGRRILSQADLTEAPDDLPIRFPAGSLGPACPAADLEVTADLRLLIADPLAEFLHASHEVLAPAKSWRDARIAQPSRQAPPHVVTQVFCAGHQIILAQGVWVESMMFPETEGLPLMHPEERAQGEGCAELELTTARPCLAEWEAKFLIEARRSAPRDRKPLRLRA